MIENSKSQPSIVERLRAHVQSHGGPAKDENGAYVGTVWPMMLEAADRIEYLEARVAILDFCSPRIDCLVRGEAMDQKEGKKP